MSHYFDGEDDDTYVQAASLECLNVGAPEPLEPVQEAPDNGIEGRREDDDDDDEEADEDGDELLWNDAHWDGIEVEEVPELPEQNLDGGGGPAPEVNPAQVNGRGEQDAEGEGGIPQDLADDLEGNVEDDMEGAMEG
jgi:E3 ubiquitin-protein ligase MARCH6